MAPRKEKKFAAVAKFQKARSTAPRTAVVHEPIAEPSHVGRPIGKRRRPDFRPTTLLLRTQTLRTARRKLEDLESDLDLSDLAEKLFTDWIGEEPSRSDVRVKGSTVKTPPVQTVTQRIVIPSSSR